MHSVEGNHVTMLDSYKIIAAIHGEPMEDPKTFERLIIEDKPLVDEAEFTRL